MLNECAVWYVGRQRFGVRRSGVHGASDKPGHCRSDFRREMQQAAAGFRSAGSASGAEEGVSVLLSYASDETLASGLQALLHIRMTGRKRITVCCCTFSVSCWLRSAHAALLQKHRLLGVGLGMPSRNSAGSGSKTGAASSPVCCPLQRLDWQTLPRWR